MFQTGFAEAGGDGSGDDVYAVQLDVALTGVVDEVRLRDAVLTVLKRYPNLVARFYEGFGEPVQIIPADPEICWQQLEFSSDSIEEQIRQHCAAERAAVCDLRDGPSFRAAVVRTGEDRHRITLTSHHIVLDGWSLPILLGEIFAAYHHTQLPAAVPYRRFVQWLADRDTAAARAAWGEVFAGFERPTLVGPPTRATAGQRGVCTNQLSVEITGAVGELARTCHATVNTVLQAAWAQLLMWQTGQRDVAFGTAVSGRPVDIPGSASMVGLLINTVPVRATLGPDTSSAALIAQLHHRHNDTLEHQHLGLNEIHRATGHEHLFDTLFVHENYPLDSAALGSADGLSITGFSASESNHYPLTLQTTPGPQLGLRLEYDTEVFDAAEPGHVVLLFNEADSLFGKRTTEVKSSNDRYANMETNYLLQRLERFGGLAILTTNLTGAVDPAFRRRFAYDVQFTFPDPEMRAELWRRVIPPAAEVSTIDYEELGERFELSGGFIKVAAERSAFQAAAMGGEISTSGLVDTVNRMYRERGKLTAVGRLE